MSMNPRYPAKLNFLEILILLKTDKYRVDLESAEVVGPSGKTIAPFETNGRCYIRLYSEGRRKKTISLPRLVWMAGTGVVIPDGFEIHHRNQDKSDNRFSNLFCLYKDDHKKLHGGDLITESDLEAIPF